MPEKKGARLDFDERWEIEDMLKESSPFREIARKLGVSYFEQRDCAFACA